MSRGLERALRGLASKSARLMHQRERERARTDLSVTRTNWLRTRGGLALFSCEGQWSAEPGQDRSEGAERDGGVSVRAASSGGGAMEGDHSPSVRAKRRMGIPAECERAGAVDVVVQ